MNAPQAERQADSALRVSVVIPAFNRERTLARAVQSALGQTERSLEVIVVDDASTDATQDVLAGIQDARLYSVRHERNQNASVARNTGIRSAAGAFIAFLDSDDEWLPDHIARRLALLRTTGADAAFGSFFVDDGSRRVLRRCARRRDGEPLLEYVLSGRGDVRTSTLVFRAEAIRKIMFDPGVRKHQDWDLAARADADCTVVCDPGPTAVLHDDAGDRMTRRLDHAATSEFLERHGDSLRRETLARFLALHGMRILRLEGRTGHYREAIGQARRHSFQAGIRLNAALWCLSRRGVDVAFVRLFDEYVRFRTRLASHTAGAGAPQPMMAGRKAERASSSQRPRTDA